MITNYNSVKSPTSHAHHNPDPKIHFSDSHRDSNTYRHIKMQRYITKEIDSSKGSCTRETIERPDSMINNLSLKQSEISSLKQENHLLKERLDKLEREMSAITKNMSPPPSDSKQKNSAMKRSFKTLQLKDQFESTFDQKKLLEVLCSPKGHHEQAFTPLHVISERDLIDAQNYSKMLTPGS